MTEALAFLAGLAYMAGARYTVDRLAEYDLGTKGKIGAGALWPLVLGASAFLALFRKPLP